MRISDWSSDVCSSDLPHVDRPGRRNHRLAVRHDDVAGGVALTHEVHHPALLGIVEIEIEIYLAPAFMDGRRHRVPHASRLEDREAHRQLRAVASAWDAGLGDRAGVRSEERRVGEEWGWTG